MNIRDAVPADAVAIAALVRGYESVLVMQPDSAAPFWESMSVQAHSRNLASPRFAYLLAEVDREVVGFIAMRDGSHLFNLFVQPGQCRRGIGRALWQHMLRHIRQPGDAGAITVNASLNAVPVYQAFGFKEEGAVVRRDGIAFVPMRWLPR